MSSPQCGLEVAHEQSSVFTFAVFLNDDDDDLHEEAEDYDDSTRDATLQGLGGWSARTRSVTFFRVSLEMMLSCGLLGWGLKYVL